MKKFAQITITAIFLSSSFYSYAAPKIANAYDGSYFVTQVEWSQFGCQTSSTQFPTIVGSSGTGTFASHFGAEHASATFVRSVTYIVDSFDGVLNVPSYQMFQQEITQNGTAPATSLRDPEGDFQIIIDPTGSLSVPGAEEEGVSIQGQFSGDGSMFTFLAVGTFPEGDCTDSFTTMGFGISRDVK